jgi:nucleoside-diphosphate-sugar epimerase
MVLRWGPGKDGVNTVHIDDVSGGLWACAKWIASLGRQQANITAGEKIYFHNDKSKVKAIEGACPPDVQPIAPIFNLVRKILPWRLHFLNILHRLTTQK